MDKELLKLSVELTKAQLQSNAIASINNESRSVEFNFPNQVTELVKTYYSKLEEFSSSIN